MKKSGSVKKHKAKWWSVMKFRLQLSSMRKDYWVWSGRKQKYSVLIEKPASENLNCDP